MVYTTSPNGVARIALQKTSSLAPKLAQNSVRTALKPRHQAQCGAEVGFLLPITPTISALFCATPSKLNFNVGDCGGTRQTLSQQRRLLSLLRSTL